MSPNGKYAGGFISSIAPDDSFQYAPTFVNIETGEWTQFGPYPEAVHYLTQALCISDQGLLFISDGYNGGQIAINLNGDIFIPEAPKDSSLNLKSRQYRPTANIGSAMP